MALDEEYAAPAAVTVSSLVEHLRPGVELKLFLMTEGLTVETRTRLESAWGDRVELRFVRVDHRRLAAMLGHRRDDTSATVHFRALVASSLPEDVSKVLYLDSDLLIRRDIHDLWTIDMRGYTILAVQDSFVPFLPEHCCPPDDSPEARRPYFNSGVMLIDLDAWRAGGLEQRYGDALRQTRGVTRWADQDALNACLVGQWGALPPTWNRQFALQLLPDWQFSPHGEREFHEAVNEPAIVHFCTRTKPWHRFCDHPAEDVLSFRSFLTQAGFAARIPAEPTRRDHLVEWFAKPHRRARDLAAILYRAARPGRALRRLGPQMVGLAARHPWTVVSVPLSILRNRVTARWS